MNEFLEKWKTDSKFKAKVQLALYAIPVVIAIILAISAGGETLKYDNEELSGFNNKEQLIEVPEEYNYLININLNGETYNYKGTKTQKQEIIQKTKNGTTENYIYKDNKYYKDMLLMNNNVTKEEVYDIVDYDYLQLETINQYLSISKKEDDKYIVNLKDIILGNTTTDYILGLTNKK